MRRRFESRLNETERHAVANVLNEAKAKKRRRHVKKKVKGWRRHELSDSSLALLCVACFLSFVYVRYSGWSEYPFLTGTSNEFRIEFKTTRQLVERHQGIYDSVRRIALEHHKSPDEEDWPSYTRNSYILNSSYGDTVNDCEVTVVLIDSALGEPLKNFGPGQSIWFTLESIAAFMENVCVVLQTRSCAMKKYLGDDASESAINLEIAQTIYECSLPLFRKLIETGRVRISLLTHEKYNLPSCESDEDLSNLLFNFFYWETEFWEVDSDSILYVNSDSCICYPIQQLQEMQQYAFVAAVWPQGEDPVIKELNDGVCEGMPVQWKKWLSPQRVRQREDLTTKKRGVQKSNEVLNEDFPSICEHGWAPIGHGGLSLRSRFWMKKAIMTCPHATYSGVVIGDNHTFACIADNPLTTGFYFATVLAGIRAPLPSAYTSSLFVGEILWPESIWELYGFPPEDRRSIRKYLSPGRPKIQLDHQSMTVPNTVERLWWYHPAALLESKLLADACPFAPYLFPSTSSRYKNNISNGENRAHINH